MSRARLRAVFLVAVAILASCQNDPGYGGRSSREWIRSLGDSSAAQRVAAADALGRVLRIQPESPRVVKALIGALGDENDAVRMAAASALTAQGVRAEGAINGLHAALHDSAHSEMRYYAALVLGRLGTAAGAGTAEALAESLDDPDPRVRAVALDALGKLGLGASPAVDAILARTHDKEPGVRLKAFETLMRVQDPDTAMVNLLGSALADSTSSVRSGVAYLLAGLRARAAAAAPALAALLRDPDTEVRSAAAFALGEIGPAACAALPALRAAQNDSDREVRTRARVAISRIDPDITR